MKQLIVTILFVFGLTPLAFAGDPPPAGTGDQPTAGADQPAASAVEAPAVKADLTRPGTYTAGKWKYTLKRETMGRDTEKSMGTLFYDGKALELKPNVNDYVRTPWGPLYWVGKRLMTWGPNGWMIQPAEGEKRIGREISVAGVPVEEAQQLPIVTGTSGEISLGREACGDYVEAVIGQIITIRLPGNPTTGYEWQALPPDHAAVVPIGPVEYHKDAQDGKAVGTGGAYVFHFRADREGAAKITLLYKRNWEKEPAERFTILVRVSSTAGTR